MNIGGSLTNTGSQHPLLLLLGKQLLVLAVFCMVQAFFNFWMAQFICIADAHVSRIQLQFFTANKLPNDLVGFFLLQNHLQLDGVFSDCTRL